MLLFWIERRFTSLQKLCCPFIPPSCRLLAVCSRPSGTITTRSRRNWPRLIRMLACVSGFALRAVTPRPWGQIMVFQFQTFMTFQRLREAWLLSQKFASSSSGSPPCQTAGSNCPDQVQRQQDLQDRHFGFQKEPLCSMVDCTEKLGGLNFPDRLTDSGVSQQLSCYYFQGIPPPLQHLRVLTSKYYCLQKIPEENISCLKPWKHLIVVYFFSEILQKKWWVSDCLVGMKIQN